MDTVLTDPTKERKSPGRQVMSGVWIRMSGNKYMIRKATEADIPAIVAIYNAVLEEEEQGRYSIGWIRGVYPTENTARRAVYCGDMFVLESDGTVIASARINHEQMPAYAAVQWSSHVPDEQVMVMHTLTVDPDMNGRGAGAAFLRFYEEYALRCGSHVLRIDTNERNLAARKMYKTLGYKEISIVPTMFNGIPDVNLVLLEKWLD